MANNNAFCPAYGSGQSVTASTSAQSLTITNGAATVVISNYSTTAAEVVYIKIGSGSITATAADYPILPGNQVPVTKHPTHDKISIVSASGSPTVHVLCGEGL